MSEESALTRPGWTVGSLQWVLAAVGALVVATAAFSGTSPGSAFAQIDSPVLIGCAAVVGLMVVGKIVLWSTPVGIWGWAGPLGALIGIAHVAGLSLTRSEADLALFSPAQPAPQALWVVAQFLGTAVAAGGAVAVGLHLLEREPRRARAVDGKAGRFDTIRRQLRRGGPAAFAIVLGVIVLSRLPYLVLWWPGIMPFDSLRPFSYAETGVWEQLDPVGHSFLIVGANWIAHSVGWGDIGGVGILAIAQVLTNSAAFAFMLARIASWGVHRWVWAVMVGWVLVLPTFGIFSTTVVKDVPFASAFIIFLTCFAELLRRRDPDSQRWWPWIGFTGAGIALFALRNNGIIVIGAALIVIAIVLHSRWRRVLAASLVTLVAFRVYVGPLMWAIDARPTRSTETWSVPLQQIARIAKDQGASLATAEIEFIESLFPRWTIAEVGEQYRPGISDPIKDEASRWWSDHPTSDVLSGWVALAVQHPMSAMTATLANTVGFWSPSARSWYGHGLTIYSRNDVRGIHLDIPYGPTGTGLRGMIERHDLLGETLRLTPLLGVALAPGLVTWMWIVSAVGAWRKRALAELAWFLPPAVLLLTMLAGPVSGSMRYALPLFSTLPLAWGLVAAARSRRQGRNGTSGVGELDDSHSAR